MDLKIIDEKEAFYISRVKFIFILTYICSIIYIRIITYTYFIKSKNVYIIINVILMEAEKWM